eukprot:TRINITY_DN2155_c0_g2_i2.p1 TRINITY_DN2155_c0_g2~~TRINITY_DN2155_c0_g2_i2.p1  ORF type:complete len:359 (+),score=81.90 TRINITY_DN2155_c0_g2_i2:170-1246(+)
MLKGGLAPDGTMSRMYDKGGATMPLKKRRIQLHMTRSPSPPLVAPAPNLEENDEIVLEDVSPPLERDYEGEPPETVVIGDINSEGMAIEESHYPSSNFSIPGEAVRGDRGCSAIHSELTRGIFNAGQHDGDGLLRGDGNRGTAALEEGSQKAAREGAHGAMEAIGDGFQDNEHPEAEIKVLEREWEGSRRFVEGMGGCTLSRESDEYTGGSKSRRRAARGGDAEVGLWKRERSAFEEGFAVKNDDYGSSAPSMDRVDIQEACRSKELLMAPSGTEEAVDYLPVECDTDMADEGGAGLEPGDSALHSANAGWDSCGFQGRRCLGILNCELLGSQRQNIWADKGRFGKGLLLRTGTGRNG